MVSKIDRARILGWHLSTSPEAAQPVGKPGSSKNWTALGAGIFLLTMAAGMVVFAAENVMAWVIGFFAFMCGIGLVMMGALDTHATKSQTHPAAHTPVVRVRCTHCSSLNLDASLRCSNCGAKL